jgi:CRISPR/Cas system-associated endoribonuclease Cas2
VRRIIGEDSQRGRDLRQNSPFAGTLSEAERRRINEEIA